MRIKEQGTRLNLHEHDDDDDDDDDDEFLTFQNNVAASFYTMKARKYFAWSET